MAFDGNGNFNRVYNWAQDKANGVNITASRVDTEDNGFAAGLTLCVTRDGQGKMSANFLPSADNTYGLGSNSFRWTGINGALSFSANNNVTVNTPTSGPALAIAGPVTGLGATAGSQLDMSPDSGSWTSTLSGGFAANPTGTVNWRRQGGIAHVWVPTFITGTSNATTDITMSGLPAAITPSSNRSCFCFGLTDNGTGTYAGLATVQSTGSILLQLFAVTTKVLIASSNTWTASGTKGIGTNNVFAITYGL